jgi:hypothetical protein
MDWIKKNPAQFGLAIVSVGVVASAFYLYTQVSAFPDRFESANREPSRNKEIPAIDTAEIDEATKSVAGGDRWTLAKGRLFTSKLYVIKGGQLRRPDTGGEPFNPPISNEWLLKYDLDLLNPGVKDEDPDRDGFSNLLEWNGADGLSHMTSTVPPEGPYGPVSGPDGKPLPADQTDPIDPKSFPPYHTRLVLKEVVNVPFRLRFMSYDVNKNDPKDVTVFINPIDRGNRTQVLQLGQDIAGTKFKTESFVAKEGPGADGTKVDVSEVTVVNKDSGEKIVLPLNKVVDSPESYVVIEYLWVAPGGTKTPDIKKQKRQKFNIPPEADKAYTVLDIRPAEVDIELPSGQKLTLRKGK